MSHQGKYFHPQTDFMRKIGVTPPEAISHGTIDDIQEKITRLKPTSWELKGNQLIGQTEFGVLVQTIPTDYILDGVDSENMPIFKKIEM